MRFRKLSFPFALHPEFPEFLVEWKVPLVRSEKLLQIQIKLLNPQILFYKSQTSLQIQELSLNPEKYSQIRKNILQIRKNIPQIRKNNLSRVNCASSQPASEFVSSFCRIQNGGALCLLFDSCGSKVNLGDKFCFKCGSKVAEISHPSERKERFSIGCRKTKTKVITLAIHKGHR